jgi:hypothetical protein
MEEPSIAEAELVDASMEQSSSDDTPSVVLVRVVSVLVGAELAYVLVG